MKEKPLIFTEDGGASIHEGRKTQTRRPVQISDFVHAAWRAGDRIWVRENFLIYGCWSCTGLGVTRTGLKRWQFKPNKFGVERREVLFPDQPPFQVMKFRSSVGWFKRPAIFMPRWACRSVLEILDVRIERLQKITEHDATAEGFRSVDQFASKWIDLYGQESWKENSQVAVIIFKKLRGEK